MSTQKLPHVFVVDDEKIIAETLSIILGQNGLAARFFTDPTEALTAARVEVPDLLLSDVMMPRISGIDLAIQVRKHCPACKVLLFSGQADTVDLLSEARNQGHDFSLFLKPIHPSDLLRRIREQDLAWVS